MLAATVHRRCARMSDGADAQCPSPEKSRLRSGGQRADFGRGDRFRHLIENNALDGVADVTAVVVASEY